MGFVTETMLSSRLPEDHDFYRYNRLTAEKKLARLERRRATRQTVKEALRLKDEVAQHIAQIDHDRAKSLRPTHQIPHNWRCVHIPERREFYKVVACTDKTFVSVYDGKTEYVLGKDGKDTPRREGEWGGKGAGVNGPHRPQSASARNTTSPKIHLTRSMERHLTFFALLTFIFIFLSSNSIDI